MDQRKVPEEAIGVSIYEPEVENRSWGEEHTFAANKDYSGKMLFVKKKSSLPLQVHEDTRASYFVASGVCFLETGPNKEELTTYALPPGSAFHVEPLQHYRIFARDTDVIMIEVTNATETVEVANKVDSSYN